MAIGVLSRKYTTVVFEKLYRSLGNGVARDDDQFRDGGLRFYVCRAVTQNDQLQIAIFIHLGGFFFFLFLFPQEGWRLFGIAGI